MTRSLALLSLALLLASSAGAATAAEQHPSVPARFQGEWTSKALLFFAVRLTAAECLNKS
jgi:hypothetical protein